jgi:hypothetical protein
MPLASGRICKELAERSALRRRPILELPFSKLLLRPLSGTALAIFQLRKTIWGGGEEPLWKQIVERWPEGEHIKEWHVCSPFWPTVFDGETPFERFQSELNKRAARLSDAELTLYAQGDAQGKNARPRFSFVLVTQLKRRGFNPARARICPVRLDPLKDEIPEGKAEDQRQLHAKWMLLKGDRTALLSLGSANFTARIWRRNNPQNANIEACVLLSGSRDVVTARIAANCFNG